MQPEVKVVVVAPAVKQEDLDEGKRVVEVGGGDDVEVIVCRPNEVVARVACQQ